MDPLNPFTLVLLLNSAIFMGVGRWMFMRPPKKINDLVGYRTRRSMAGQEEWDYAQKISAARMERYGWIEAVIAMVWIFIPGVDSFIETMIATVGIIASCVVLMVQTENDLKERFG